MAIKALQKSVKKTIQRHKKDIQVTDDKVKKFISKGGTLADSFEEKDGDHRLTLRIPNWLMEKVDDARKKRVGKISRNLWILEVIEKTTS